MATRNRGVVLSLLLIGCLFVDWVTATATARVFNITVGYDEQGREAAVFVPDIVMAHVGDVINFHFHLNANQSASKNHTVIRAAYGKPCTPYEETTKDGKKTSFTFHGGGSATNAGPDPRIVINDTEPIFFYNSLDEACSANQMIGAINPNSTQTLARQKQLADPRVRLPPIGKGILVGGAVGVLLFLGIAMAVCFFAGRRSGRSDGFGLGVSWTRRKEARERDQEERRRRALLGGWRW
ncbi:hypothetical protein CC80DRAFT_547913 [Byssothecium circinans]|uniref:Cupredoxin n=1 Tax=Byssothecium circinans TaxID=147558 RepID=A0A6A5TX25_9PLEO|nr:hypothetical protein CC80DRAFT_547913 [Byssothecium circinans]